MSTPLKTLPTTQDQPASGNPTPPPSPFSGGSTSSATEEPENHQDLHVLTILLQLEAQARSTHNLKELQFLMVNDTRKLLPYRQAFFVQAGSTSHQSWRVEAASSLPIIQRDAPLIRWLERTIGTRQHKDQLATPQTFTEEDGPTSGQQEWKEFSFPYVCWCPLRVPHSFVIGGLWLAKDQPWQESERTVLQRLADTYAHAWGALAGNKGKGVRNGGTAKWYWTGLLMVLGAMWIPVSMSTLAPTEVVAKDPTIVSAPINGVIADILVPPNTMVTKDQTLFVYEDTNFRSQYEVAENNLATAIAEYRKTAQGAFFESETNAQVPLAKAEVALRETERDFAQERLAQVEVKALQAGLLVYTDKSDWIGKPVEIGQRIMEIADPTQVELHIHVPVEDAIILKKNARLDVFLDAKPLETLTATIVHASYHAEILHGNILAYRVRGQFTDPASEIRIGWRGTAKIYGDDVSLFFLLFRRPISTFRQFVGI